MMFVETDIGQFQGSRYILVRLTKVKTGSLGSDSYLTTLYNNFIRNQNFKIGNLKRDMSSWTRILHHSRKYKSDYLMKKSDF